MVEKLIQCLICGGGYHVLSSHIGVHNTTSADYKDKFGLPSNAPLQSGKYVDMMRGFALRPEQLEQSRSLSLDWNKGYRHSITILAEQGYLVPSEASRMSGIPRTTLYNAMQSNILPFAEASILVILGEGDDVRVLGSRQPVKLILQEDLTNYALRHRSLSGKSG